jgi:hypothetical protein
MERNFYSMFSNVVNYINNPPYLYRYEDKKYIDDFFDKGQLLISSFKQYKAYQDNQLGDKEEGQSMNIGTTDHDKQFMTFTTVGHNDYCFCTSTILDKGLYSIFKRESAFRIKDPINFILEINRSLLRVREVLYGNCIYLNERILKKKIGNVTIDHMRDDKEPDKISLEKIMGLPIHGPESYFLKQIHYQTQSEYRIIWKTDREVAGNIVINCPEAVKYCEKIEDLELS